MANDSGGMYRSSMTLKVTVNGEAEGRESNGTPSEAAGSRSFGNRTMPGDDPRPRRRVRWCPKVGNYARVRVKRRESNVQKIETGSQVTARGMPNPGTERGETKGEVKRCREY